MREIIGFVLLLFSGMATAIADECAGNLDAVGTSRVIVVDPTEHPRVGSAQYPETLPLEDREVVLTFDDGPLAPFTTRILDTLASNCVKANFFIVGSMANSEPDLVRREYREGHTLGTHTQNHPLNLGWLSSERAEREIRQGIASVANALGEGIAPAPFFRFPGLGRTEALERYLEQQKIMIWSADVIPDDWKRISPDQVTDRSLEGLKRKGRGILLLHDIHERTAEALPTLLKKLKSAGFHVVHVVPVSPDRAKTVAAPAQWTLQTEEGYVDPRPAEE